MCVAAKVTAVCARGVCGLLVGWVSGRSHAGRRGDDGTLETSVLQGPSWPGCVVLLAGQEPVAKGAQGHSSLHHVVVLADTPAGLLPSSTLVV